MDHSSPRLEYAKKIIKEAAADALREFSRWKNLAITEKGAQDFVSEVDKGTELFLRSKIEAEFPDDGIVGEEFGRTNADADYQWVLDPIDGTANYISGVPAWCIVIALVKGERIVAGVIYDPNHDELLSQSSMMSSSSAESLAETVPAHYRSRTSPISGTADTSSTT
jgi:myo-inositol-1(or 4)-monophosphatase